MGVIEVWAADYHKPAINCTIMNAKRHQNFGPVHIVHSDLFAAIPKDKKFDLMVFNQPYAPENSGKRRFGNDEKRGREVIRRFFEQAINHLSKNGKILMPYSDIVDLEHSPQFVSRKFELNVKKDFEIIDEKGVENLIFEFSKK